MAGSPATVQKTALAIAGLVGSHEVVELLATSATLLHSGPGSDWNGPIYVATPQLLAAFHIRSSEVSPKADILSMRPGLAEVANMHLVALAPSAPQGAPPCQSDVCATPSGPYEPRQVGHIDRPVVQELGSLPSGHRRAQYLDHPARHKAARAQDQLSLVGSSKRRKRSTRLSSRAPN